MRAIDADAKAKHFRKLSDEYSERERNECDIRNKVYCRGRALAFATAADLIDIAPTLDVQPIVYATIKQSDDMFMIHGEMVRSWAKKCTNCGGTLCNEVIQHGCKYCYHCGAKMDKE